MFDYLGHCIVDNAVAEAEHLRFCLLKTGVALELRHVSRCRVFGSHEFTGAELDALLSVLYVYQLIGDDEPLNVLVGGVETVATAMPLEAGSDAVFL